MIWSVQIWAIIPYIDPRKNVPIELSRWEIRQYQAESSRKYGNGHFPRFESGEGEGEEEEFRLRKKSTWNCSCGSIIAKAWTRWLLMTRDALRSSGWNSWQLTLLSPGSYKLLLSIGRGREWRNIDDKMRLPARRPQRDEKLYIEGRWTLIRWVGFWWL